MSMFRRFSIRHHYIPQFYLKFWTGDDGRLERYTRPIASKIMVRRAFPSETGFEPDLYRAPVADPIAAHRLETDFLQQLDSRAALVFAKLNAFPPCPLATEDHSTLSVFVRGMTYRSPAMLEAFKVNGRREWWQIVDDLEAHYEARRAASDPATYREFRAGLSPERAEASVLEILPEVFASPAVGQMLNNLPKRLIDIPASVPELLLSDDPLARTNGLLVENGHFAMPIAPRRLLVMARDTDTLEKIVSQTPRELVTNMNRWTVESARLFVAARDRSQDRFIRNRFGRDPKSPISG